MVTPISSARVTPPSQAIQVEEKVTSALTPVQKASPLPAPISPFPWDVRQQVGVLQAHGRFFFGGNPTLPEIALTFDDGPDPPYTNEILAVLKQYNVKASFFCIGHQVIEHPELVKQEFEAGHTVAIHSWDHVHLPTYSVVAIDKQLGNTSDSLKKITGVQPGFFRPPYGAYSSTVLAEANKMGLTTFLWNDVASDWLLPGAPVISARIINAARDGSIVLLHDGDGDHYHPIASREQTVQALPTIITILRARGYRFVTLDQLVADRYK
ncbi:MAG: polysaccharide deacetylase family protein [Ktedonobacteraceae bacterium]|nr:polysaccharide deacetylase family protein [Ktedonobacteraceae bacterium]